MSGARIIGHDGRLRNDSGFERFVLVIGRNLDALRTAGVQEIIENQRIRRVQIILIHSVPAKEKETESWRTQQTQERNGAADTLGTGADGAKLGRYGATTTGFAIDTGESVPSAR